MRYKIFTFLVIVFLLNSCTISKFQDKSLKNELNSIRNSDQNLRKLYTNISNEKRIEILSQLNITEEEFKLRDGEIMKEYDSINLNKVKTIISKYGYPSKEIVGNDLSNVVWLVIQHSDLKTIEKYFPLIKKANKKGDLENKYVALMQDRMLMYQGKEQIYGTQIAGRIFFNPKTNEELGFKYFIWPLKDKSKVNEMRKSVGFKDTIEELAKSMDIENNSFNYTIEEINRISKEIN